MPDKAALYRLPWIMGYDSLDAAMVYVRGTQRDLRNAVEEIVCT